MSKQKQNLCATADSPKIWSRLIQLSRLWKQEIRGLWYNFLSKTYSAVKVTFVIFFDPSSLIILSVYLFIIYNFQKLIPVRVFPTSTSVTLNTSMLVNLMLVAIPFTGILLTTSGTVVDMKIPGKNPLIVVASVIYFTTFPETQMVNDFKVIEKSPILTRNIIKLYTQDSALNICELLSRCCTGELSFSLQKV